MSAAGEARAGGVWPRSPQVLLLRAALLDGEAALAAWHEWLGAVDIEALDPASYRVLPLLWHNLSHAGVDHPLLERCRGVFRHTWSKNQLLLHRTAPLLRAFGAAGIPLLVLKGGALGQLYYPSPGARPMNDLDVMVPFAAASAARELLERAGWRPTLDLPPAQLAFIHALGYRDGAGTELDLHWHALWEGARPGADDPLWRRAQPLRLAGLELATLCATDHLFQVCVHGLRWSEVPPIHWVADAALLLRSGAIDWVRLVEHGERERLTLQLLAALGFLRETLELPIPDEAIARLRAAPASAGERLELWARMQPPALVRGLWLHWCDHRRQNPGSGRLRRARGFPVYLRTIWGLGSLAELPAATWRKSVRRLARRAA